MQEYTNFDIINDINPASSVLIIGAGFSLESKNVRNERPPNGAELRRHFARSLGYPSDTSYNLQILAEEFAVDNASSLHHELCEIFRIASFSPSQAVILREEWQRIYTTNYDDTVEVSRHERKRPPLTYDVSEEIPNKLPQSSVIHLHGSIRLVAPDNPLTSLVLGEASYVRQYLSKTLWYDQFLRDIRFASKVFIVGYGLADYHISALLLQAPELAKKTFFIQSHTPDQVFIRRTEAYGKALFIGLDGFAKALQSLPRPPHLTDIRRLKSFRFLDPHVDKRTVRQPTASEIYELLVFGNFNAAICALTLPKSDYVITRQEKINEFTEKIKVNRTIVIDSRLGNGKTIFLALAFFAISSDCTCFMFRERSPEFDKEIERLASVKNVVIFFEKYTAAQDYLPMLAQKLPEAKFVVEVRTPIFEVRFHEIDEVLPRPYTRISLNKLSPPEFEELYALCHNAGLRVPEKRGGKVPELRDILLETFENSQIQTRLRHTLAPIFGNQSRRKILLLTMLLAGHQAAAEPGFIAVVTGVDPYREFRAAQELASEIFEMSSEEFRIRTAVFSEYAVNTFMEPVEIADCIVQATIAASSRKADRRYRVLMSNLMQYSNLAHTLRRWIGVDLIVNIYERLRYDARINSEPLYWLQYAIAMSEKHQLGAALQFIDAAYERARELPGFQTYQIDTQALRILLVAETEAGAGTPVVGLERIMDKLEKVDSMLGEQSHRAHIIKVLECVAPFIARRSADLTQPEKIGLVFWIGKLVSTLGLLPAEYRARSGSDKVRGSLERAKNQLL